MNLEDEHSELKADNTSSTESVSPRKPAGSFQERPPQVTEAAPQLLRHWTRRDLLLFGMGAIAALAGGGSLLPQTTLERLGIIHGNENWPKKEWFLNRASRIDDDVAEALMNTGEAVRECRGQMRSPPRRSTCKIPVRSMPGVGGHPGMYPSTGITASTGPTTAWLPPKIPPLQPQAPTATTSFGEGTAS